MRQPPTLRNTIILSFCLFGLILTACYGTSVFLGMRLLEDRLFKNQLQSIVESYLHGAASGSPQLTQPGLTTYLGTEEMPLSLVNLVKHYPLGYHELHFKQAETEYELHIAIQQRPGTTKRLYFIYDVNGLEVSENRQYAFILLLILTGALVCCLGLVIGFLIAGRITSPLSELTRRIQSFSDKDLPTNLVTPGVPEEINFLGRSLEHANERINHFLVREKEFTRNASHELRTPLTVIKGATELLEKQLSAKGRKYPRAIDRINRSIQEMELTNDTFLMLAREDNVPPAEKVELGKLCSTTVDELQLLAIDQNMVIRIECKKPVILLVSPQVIRIILSNLLRNAIQHSAGKKILIRVAEDRLQVVDDGCGITNNLAEKVQQLGMENTNSFGTGFGLSIVERICTRLGWSLKIESPPKAGTKITVIFKQPQN